MEYFIVARAEKISNCTLFEFGKKNYPFIISRLQVHAATRDPPSFV